MSTINSLIRITTETELEGIHTETFINTTDGRVTKVTDESVVRGMIRGNVKTGKKALKDIALAISHLFIDSSFGNALDTVADERGVSPRFTAAQSQTWVRLVALPGTVYTIGVNTVSDKKGNVFDLEKSITIGDKGYGYVPVRCQQAAASTNVDPYTIINVSPQPVGHIGVINEYAATGGRDLEDDDTFRQRIKEGPDIFARGTLSYLGQALMSINSNVLRVLYNGIDPSGKVILSIVSVNGILFTTDELNQMTARVSSFLSLTEMAPIGTQSYGIVLQNVNYYPIDSIFRARLISGTDLQQVAVDIQTKWTKFVDFRKWDSTKGAIQWTDLLSIAKGVDGVDFIPDTYFLPNVDIQVPIGSFPVFRQFTVMDLDGNIMIDQQGNISPVFYPNAPEPDFTSTVI